MLGVAIVIAVVLAGVLLHPTTRVAGSPSVDGYGTAWFFWFAGEVLAGRQPLAHTDLLFHPWGKDVYAHTGGNLVDAWLAWPLRVAFGPVAGLNLWIAAVLASNAWAGWRLASAFGVKGPWRVVSALLLVLNPYVLGELDLGRPTQAWLAPAGLALAALVGMRTWRQAVVAGGWLALTALAYWYYGLMAAAVASILGAWRLAFGSDRPVAARNLAVATVVSLAVVTPFALPMLRALGEGSVPGLLALDGDGPIAPLALRTVEGDAQGLYVVAPLNAQAGSLLDEGGLRFNPGISALGVVHLVIAAVGLGWTVNRRGRVATGWVFVATLVMLDVACGPAIVAGSWMLPNRPWIALVAGSEILRRWWWPGRAIALVHVLLAPVAARVLAALPGRARGLTTGATLVGVLVPLRREALLPLGTWDAAVDPTLACVAAAPEGAVIDLPLLVDQRNLWYQTVHGKPILGGMLLKKAAFAPPEFNSARRVLPLLATLDAIGEHQYTRAVDPATAVERAQVLGLGLRYVLARKDAFRRPRTSGGETTWVSEWSRPRRQLVALLGEPATEDDALALWTLDGSAPACPPARPGAARP